VRIPRRSRTLADSSAIPRTVVTGAARIPPLLGLDDEGVVRLAATTDLHLRSTEARAQPLGRAVRFGLGHIGSGVEGRDADAFEPRGRLLEDPDRIGPARDETPVEQRDGVAGADGD